MGLIENADAWFMREAIKEAHKAFESDEVPVGAIVVCEGRLVARAHNQTERLTDATAHAEMLAMTAAAEYLGAKYLEGCTMYVTLEPCAMCAGASFWTRIGRIVAGAADPKRGFLARGGLGILHPKTRYEQGQEASECAELLRVYFKAKRE